MARILNMCFLVVLIGLLVLSAPTNGATIYGKRSTDSDIVEYCDTQPCGWAVYTPFTRDVNYFMKNTCSCTNDKQCIRTDDDLSVSAYVYRCRALPKKN